MPDPELVICITYGKIILTFPTALARLSKLWTIPILNHRLDWDLCKNFFVSFDFHIFSFFLVLNQALADSLYIDFTHNTASYTATDCMITSQIRSHIEYVIQTYNILVLILY